MAIIALSGLMLLLIVLGFSARIGVRAQLQAPVGDIVLWVGWWRHRIRLEFRFRFHFFREPRLSLLWYKRNGEVRIVFRFSDIFARPKEAKSLGHALLHAILTFGAWKQLSIYGRIGVKDDAAATALLNGLASEGVRTALSCLLHERVNDVLQVCFQPDFQRDVLRINLECIVALSPIHIISTIAIWKSTAKKGRKQACHIPLKPS